MGTEADTLDAIVRHASHLWLFLEQSSCVAISILVELLLDVVLSSEVGLLAITEICDYSYLYI
jgi:hypothetical protein